MQSPLTHSFHVSPHVRAELRPCICAAPARYLGPPKIGRWSAARASVPWATVPAVDSVQPHHWGDGFDPCSDTPARGTWYSSSEFH
jgi:hypothetical protein